MGNHRTTSGRSARRWRQAFTLVEMLVVMGIIVLAIALAVPAIRYLTGSKSVQSAQNAVAAMLARARTDAIALQQPQGVLFTVDAASDRVTLYQVVQSTQAGDPPGITYLDLTPDRDPLVLPPGVRAWTIRDPYPFPAGTIGGIAYTDPFAGSAQPYRYLGFNPSTYSGTSAPTDKAVPGGVILFDAQGNLLVARYGLRFLNSGGLPTALSGALFTGAAASPPANMPAVAVWPSTTPYYLRSQLGLALFDKDAFQSQQPSTATSKDANTPGAEATLDKWIDDNSSPLLVNNYNGTLTRAE